MDMIYCTSCGETGDAKICESCGVARGTKHNYCGWCKSEIKEGAAICLECKERVKVTKGVRLRKVLDILIAMFLLYLSVVAFTDDAKKTSSYLIAIILLCLAIFHLPYFRELIKRKTIGNKKKRIAIHAIKGIVCFIIFINAMASSEIEVTYSVATTPATKAAVVVFHEEVTLKNVDSFVVNDSVVRAGEPNEEGVVTVTVTIDYSAQNGFGGLNRDNKDIKLLFSTESGGYFRTDGTIISY